MNLFVFGLGYSAGHFVDRFGDRFEHVAATVRMTQAGRSDRISPNSLPPQAKRSGGEGKGGGHEASNAEKSPHPTASRGEGNAPAITPRARGEPERAPPSPLEPTAKISLHPFDGASLDASARENLARATHILVSIPPDAPGDPVLRACADAIAQSPARWIGYLSSIAVYGDHAGAWVDESAALNAVSARGKQRIDAEQNWLDLAARAGKAAHVFRLAGIYGPGRNALVNLRAGTAKRIVKQGQVFNRIHVDDISRIVAATLHRDHGSEIWNVADNEPAPPQDVVAFAAGLLGFVAPPETPFDPARLSPMAASFYGDAKRVLNRRVREELALDLAYPTYREGLRALAAAGEGRAPASAPPQSAD